MRSLNPNSLNFKISVLALVILAVILVLYSGMLFFSYRYTLYQEADSGLQAKAQKIHNAIISYLDVLGYDSKSFEFSVNRVVSQTGHHPHENKIEKLEQLWLGQARPSGIGDDFVMFLDGKGQALSRSFVAEAGIPPIPPKDIRTALTRGHILYRDIKVGRKPFRGILMPVTYYKLPRDRQYLIWVASSSEKMMAVLRVRLLTKGIGIALILVVAAFLSQGFVRRVLKPIRDITWTAKNINYKDLSLRIRTENIDVEMKDLVDSLNEMMSRLEKSFKYIAEFSSHVSHELKTPLAILRGESELALRSEHSNEDYKKVIKGNLEEIIRMTKIIEDLLLMTKLDYQPEIFKLVPLDLNEFFEEIAESTRLLAGEKNIRVEVTLPKEEIVVQGDRVHLRRLFFNLINNAIKFTRPNGCIGLDVKKNGRSVRVAVSDTGVGIPEEHLEKIFDKFFHYDETDSVSDMSNGLGLSIAQSIAKIHAGDIQVQSRVGEGSTFTVRLPMHGASLN
jgi:two-component system, OmpR family, heavy metal sensor histidine kinase CusS